MSWADALENINYVSVLIGALIAVVMGFVWYAPQLFGKQWQKLVGLKKKDIEDRSGMPVMLTVMALFYALVSLVVAALFEMTGGEGLAEGLLLGAILGFVFGFGPIMVNYTFARRRFELSLLDGGFVVVTTALIGTVVGILA